MHSRKPIIPALTLLLLLPAALIRGDDAPNGDPDLDGEWAPATTVVDGKEVVQPQSGEMPVTNFKGEVMTGRLGDMKHTMTVRPDPSKSPHTIDLIPDDGPDKGKTALGVYEIKDGELLICFTKPGGARPTDVTSKQGSGRILWALKRVKK